MIPLALLNEANCKINQAPKKTAEDTWKEYFDPGPVVIRQGAFGLTENLNQKQFTPLPFGNYSTPWPQDTSQHEKNLNCHPEKKSAWEMSRTISQVFSFTCVCTVRKSQLSTYSHLSPYSTKWESYLRQ